MNTKTETQGQRRLDRLWRRGRPLIYKDMTRQRLDPDERAEFVERIKNAEAALLEKYPELEERNIMVEWQQGRILPAEADGWKTTFDIHGNVWKNGTDCIYEVYYFTGGPAEKPGFGATAAHALSGRGKVDAGEPMELTRAPDAVLAQVVDTFDDFVAAVEMTVRGALFLLPGDREDKPRIECPSSPSGKHEIVQIQIDGSVCCKHCDAGGSVPIDLEAVEWDDE